MAFAGATCVCHGAFAAEPDALDELFAEEGADGALALLAALREVDEKHPARTAGKKKDAAERAKAFAAKLGELDKRLRALPKEEREKTLAALPVVLARKGAGEPAVHAASLLGRFKGAALAEPTHRGLELALERLANESGMLPGPAASAVTELAGRFAKMLGELGRRASLPLALRAWSHEARRLGSANALRAIILLGDGSHAKVFDDAFQSARTAEVRRWALVGQCRFGSSDALATAQSWLAQAIERGDAEAMRYVRSALRELPASAGDAAMKLVRARLGALRSVDELPPKKRAEQLAGWKLRCSWGSASWRSRLPSARICSA